MRSPGVLGQPFPCTACTPDAHGALMLDERHGVDVRLPADPLAKLVEEERRALGRVTIRCQRYRAGNDAAGVEAGIERER
jgi:hypothetical protein